MTSDSENLTFFKFLNVLSNSVSNGSSSASGMHVINYEMEIHWDEVT